MATSSFHISYALWALLAYGTPFFAFVIGVLIATHLRLFDDLSTTYIWLLAIPVGFVTISSLLMVTTVRIRDPGINATTIAYGHMTSVGAFLLFIGTLVLYGTLVPQLFNQVRTLIRRGQQPYPYTVHSSRVELLLANNGATELRRTIDFTPHRADLNAWIIDDNSDTTVHSATVDGESVEVETSVSGQTRLIFPTATLCRKRHRLDIIERGRGLDTSAGFKAHFASPTELFEFELRFPDSRLPMSISSWMVKGEVIEDVRLVQMDEPERDYRFQLPRPLIGSAVVVQWAW